MSSLLSDESSKTPDLESLKQLAETPVPDLAAQAINLKAQIDHLTEELSGIKIQLAVQFELNDLKSVRFQGALLTYKEGGVRQTLDKKKFARELVNKGVAVEVIEACEVLATKTTPVAPGMSIRLPGEKDEQ